MFALFFEEEEASLLRHQDLDPTMEVRSQPDFAPLPLDLLSLSTYLKQDYQSLV